MTEPNPNVNFFRDQVQGTVAQYSEADLASLQAKLGQYPAGTKFWLNIFGPPDRVASVLAAIDETSAAHGFQVDTPLRPRNAFDSNSGRVRSELHSGSAMGSQPHMPDEFRTVRRKGLCKSCWPSVSRAGFSAISTTGLVRHTY